MELSIDELSNETSAHGFSFASLSGIFGNFERSVIAPPNSPADDDSTLEEEHVAGEGTNFPTISVLISHETSKRCIDLLHSHIHDGDEISDEYRLDSSDASRYAEPQYSEVRFEDYECLLYSRGDVIMPLRTIEQCEPKKSCLKRKVNPNQIKETTGTFYADGVSLEQFMINLQDKLDCREIDREHVWEKRMDKIVQSNEQLRRATANKLVWRSAW